MLGFEVRPSRFEFKFRVHSVRTSRRQPDAPNRFRVGRHSRRHVAPIEAPLTHDHARIIALFGERAKLSEALGDVAELAADHAHPGNAHSRLGDQATACTHGRAAHSLYGRVGRATEQRILAGLIRENGCPAKMQ